MMKHTGARRSFYVVCALWALLFCAILLGLVFGSVWIAPSELILAVSGHHSDTATLRLILHTRLLRVLGAVFAGMGLSTAGVILQSVMNNPLASPSTIGVNAGAGLLIMLVNVFFPQMYGFVPLAAFLGALGTTLLILLLARGANRSRITIILAGLAIAGIVNAGMSALKALYPETAIDLASFLIGSLSSVTTKQILPAFLLILLASLLTFLLAPYLKILSLGDSAAGSLGAHVVLLRFVFLVIASILAGSVVSYAGFLGFVGLLVPHICRRLVGNEPRLLIACSIAFGGILVILSDLLSRVLFAPYELAVGILMSVVGGVFFLYLLLRRGEGQLGA